MAKENGYCFKECYLDIYVFVTCSWDHILGYRRSSL